MKAEVIKLLDELLAFLPTIADGYPARPSIMAEGRRILDRLKDSEDPYRALYIRGVLPPSFRTWHQLLKKIQATRKHPEDHRIVWLEFHPAGMRQGYEFTLDEIKARAYDELINSLEKLTDAAALEHDPDDRHAALENLYRHITNRYFPKP